MIEDIVEKWQALAASNNTKQMRKFAVDVMPTLLMHLQRLRELSVTATSEATRFKNLMGAVLHDEVELEKINAHTIIQLTEDNQRLHDENLRLHKRIAHAQKALHEDAKA